MEEKIAKLTQHFATLATANNKHTIEEAILSIKSLLSGSDKVRLLISGNMRSFLIEGLKPTTPVVVRDLTLSQLVYCAEEELGIQIFADLSILNSIFEAFVSDSVGLSSKAETIFIKMCHWQSGFRLLLDDQIVTRFKLILEQSSETIKFRVLHTMANIASISIQTFQLCESNGFLHEILKSFEVDDILQKMNAIEILETLIENHEGVSFLENSKTLDKLKLSLESDDPLNSMLLPGLIRFFGKLALKGEVAVAYLEKNKIIQSIKSHIDEGTDEVKGASLTAVGEIGSTVSGLTLIDQYKLLDELTYYIQSEGDLRLTALHSIATMTSKLSKLPGHTPDTEKILRKLIYEVRSRTTHNQINLVNNILMTNARSPFPELRYSSYDALSGLASLQIGLEALMNYPGFFEWVTNRTTDATKEGKEWKYGIIQSMLLTSTKVGDRIIDKTSQKELQIYLKQGPFYQKAESRADIATQDAM